MRGRENATTAGGDEVREEAHEGLRFDIPTCELLG